jgi:metal-responsive CopG/Arc/MetJ family transcriptional regulator
MKTTKITITIDQALLARLDRLVPQHRFPNRSRALQEALRDKLGRLDRSRLARECAKLDPAFEQHLAEEGLVENLKQWPDCDWQFSP